MLQPHLSATQLALWSVACRAYCDVISPHELPVACNALNPLAIEIVSLTHASDPAVCTEMPHVVHMAVAGFTLVLYLAMAIINLLAVSWSRMRAPVLGLQCLTCYSTSANAANPALCDSCTARLLVSHWHVCALRPSQLGASWAMQGCNPNTTVLRCSSLHWFQ